VSTDKLPAGWRRVKFGDVVRKVSDRVDPETAGIERYVAGEHMETDDLTIRRWGDVGDGYLGPAFHMRFKPGQVLYGSRRTYLRKVAVADFEGICANTTFVLEPSSKDLLPGFLPLVMTTEAFHDHSVRQSKGSVNPYINFSDLTWYEFALPPLEEQQRTIALLAVNDHLVAALGRTVVEANALSHSVMDSLTSALGGPPTTLARVATWRRGYSFNGSDYGTESDVPFLTLASVDRSGGYRAEGLKFLRQEPKASCIASPNDLLIANTDLTPGREFIGRPFMAPNTFERIGFSHHLSMVSVEERSLREWLFWEMQTRESRKFVRSISRGSTVIMLDMKALGNWPVRVPSEEVRQSILQKVNAAVEVATTAIEELGRAKSLRKELLELLIGGAYVQ
jgi:type I restriction enzyme S subunit